MAIFKNFYKRNYDDSLFLELNINGQEQGGQDTETTDYTQDTSQQSSDGGGNDTNSGGGETTDYTQSDTSADTSAPAGNPGDPGATEEIPTTDYTAADTGDSGSSGDSGGGDGDTTDYTQMDTQPNGEEGDGTEGGDDASPESGDADGGESDDEIKKIEDELFASLSPEQLEIKNRELKNLYSQLYDTTETIISRINEIPKIEKYLSIVEFISDKLAELRNAISDYVNGGTYKSLSYTENSINYNKFVSVLQGINKMIEEIKVEDDEK